MFAARNMMFAGGASYDADAADYFDRIIAAESSISTENKDAVNNFIVGCKADGIWDAIKASCLLAGPDTLAGALVPLVGPAPTNSNFVDADYLRTTGLKGDGATKQLLSGRISSSDPQNNRHISAWQSVAATTIGVSHSHAGDSAVGSSGAYSPFFASSGSSAFLTRCLSGSYDTHTAANQSNNGLFGMSRSASSGYTARANGVSDPRVRSSDAPTNNNICIFSRGSSYHTTARLAFYSIGESLDLALLDARLTTYMAALT